MSTTHRVLVHLTLSETAAATLAAHPDPAAEAVRLLGLPPTPRTPHSRQVGSGLANPGRPRLPLRLPPADARNLPELPGPIVSALLDGTGTAPIAVPAELLQRVRALAPGPIEQVVVAMLRAEVERLEAVLGEV
jgi:hypothetical protein